MDEYDVKYLVDMWHDAKFYFTVGPSSIKNLWKVVWATKHIIANIIVLQLWEIYIIDNGTLFKISEL